MRTAFVSLMVLFGVFFVNLACAQTIEFEIKKGDNFWKLSKQYDVKHSIIINLNKNKLRNPNNPHLIYPGQKFIVEVAEKIVSVPMDNIVVQGKKEDNFSSQLSALINMQKVESEYYQSISEKSDFFNKMVQFGIIVACLVAIFICLLVTKKLYDSGPELVGDSEKVDEDDLSETILKKNIKKGNVKSSIFIIKDHDDINDSSEERCFIGVDSKNNFHCIGTEVEMHGTALEVAKFAARVYGKEYENSLVYIDNKSFGEIFSVRPLKSMEKIELENKIMKELYGT